MAQRLESRSRGDTHLINWWPIMGSSSTAGGLRGCLCLAGDSDKDIGKKLREELRRVELSR